MKLVFKNKTKLSTAHNPVNTEEAIQVSLPFIHKQAHKWTKNHHHLYEDFVSEGYCGVLEAFKRFKGSDFEERGYRFSSYAWLWIRAYMKDFANRQWKRMNNESGSDSAEWLENNGDTFELSTELIDVKKIFSTLSEADQKLLELKALGNTYEEIAEEMGFPTLHKARQRHMALLDKLQ